MCVLGLLLNYNLDLETSRWAQAMAWSAFNGVGLAFVLPCAQSLVADYYAPAVRGRAFGFVFTMAALGALLNFLTRCPG